MSNPAMRSDHPELALPSLRSVIENLRNEISVARRLVESGHAVALEGFERQVGPLCAQVLDLPAEQGLALRQDLVDLLDEVNALAVALTPRLPAA